MKRVWTFFYGSFINLTVLKQYQVFPEEIQVAKLEGFDIRIEPLATLVKNESSSTYGIVGKVTHEELETLYTLDWVGRYDPEPVIVQTENGNQIPALTYISDQPDKSPAAQDYVLRIVQPAKDWGFPDWYIDKLLQFLVLNE